MKNSLQIAIIFIASFVISQCGQTRSGTFGSEVIPFQKFEIDISKDTLVETAGGIVVLIKAGSLSTSNGNKVVLKIKEALQIVDMIKAGLTTTANGELLSSGGMFLIEPEDKSVQIVSDISVFVPTDFIEKTNVYKGTVADNRKINWENPEPVQIPEAMNKYARGEEFFKLNCIQCHSIGSGPTVGPDLLYITKRRDFGWLDAFTKNSQEYMRRAHFDRLADTTDHDDFYFLYSLCHYNEYSKTVMPAFNITPQEMHDLYDYIENESDRFRLPMPEDKLFHCVDSCFEYMRLKAAIERNRNALIRDNGKLLNCENIPTTPPASQTAPINNTIPSVNRVEPIVVNAKYYQVNIKTFGWFNIDILLKDVNGVKNSNLIVRLRGTYTKNISLYLAIPSHKVYAEGGRLTTGENDYGFFEKNGTIPLPQKQTVYVLAVGESSGKFLFGSAEFMAVLEQTITIEPVEVSKEVFDAAVKKMTSDDIQISLDKSKNADEIKELDKKLDNIETLKPKNCDCNCASYGHGEAISPLFP